MNTKLLMTVSALLMGVAGIILSFFPQEILAYAGTGAASPIMLQLLGALYFSFAILNWTARANLLGGIYSRPVSLGNFTHFAIGGLALAKYSLSEATPSYAWAAAGVYLFFGILFGYVLFTGPVFRSRAA